MNFRIQASCPQIIKINLEEDFSIGETIEDIFPMNNEEAIMVWNHTSIPLNYKYDISIMIEDIMEMLKTLLENEKGDLIIHWPSNTFRVDWFLEWNTNLKITSDWANVVGDVESILNKKNILEIGKSEFIYEWKKLLQVLLTNLKKSGYHQINPREFSDLYELEKKISTYGKLYTSFV
jgi:hypothetical protein